MGGSTPDEFNSSAQYDAVLMLAVGDVGYIVERMEADPEHNAPAVLIYESAAPFELVTGIHGDISVPRVLACVDLYRAAHPRSCCANLCKIPKSLGTFGFCGPVNCGKTMAATTVGSELYKVTPYYAFIWSFAYALKKFCIRYYDGGSPAVDMITDAYFRDKALMPPCVVAWKAAGAVMLPPTSAIRSLLACVSAENAERVRGRLERMLTRHLAELDGRKLMQITGSTFRDICGLDFWIMQMASEMCKYRTYNSSHATVNLIDDVRFPNEAEWLRANGATLLRITTLASACEPPKHSSELLNSNIQCDREYVNAKVSCQQLLSQLMPFILETIHANKQSQ
jgi:hypothetical protein